MKSLFLILFFSLFVSASAINKSDTALYDFQKLDEYSFDCYYGTVEVYSLIVYISLNDVFSDYYSVYNFQSKKRYKLGDNDENIVCFINPS